MKKLILAVSVAAMLGATASAASGTRAEEYRGRAIADASRFVAAQAAASLAPESGNEFTTGKVAAQLGLERFYRKGDRWIMQVTYVNPGMVRKTGGPEASHDSFADPIYFEFKVEGLSVDQSQARIVVTQVTKAGVPVNQRLQSARITVNRGMKLVSKEYFYRDLGGPVSAEYSGTRNLPMGFDTFPIELPDFEGARVLAPASLANAGPDEPIRFECRDLFMRKMDVEWNRGSLWPAQIKNHSGIATLILMEKAS